MKLDDEICLCFHVSKRKVLGFLRIERPTRAGQLSECFGAGTGCGWCRPFLRELFEKAAQGQATDAAQPAAEQYEQQRKDYLRHRGSVPAHEPGGEDRSAAC